MHTWKRGVARRGAVGVRARGGSRLGGGSFFRADEGVPTRLESLSMSPSTVMLRGPRSRR